MPSVQFESVLNCTMNSVTLSYLPVELLSKPDHASVFVDGKIPHGLLSWNAVDQRLPLRISCFQLSDWRTCQTNKTGWVQMYHWVTGPSARHNATLFSCWQQERKERKIKNPIFVHSCKSDNTRIQFQLAQLFGIVVKKKKKTQATASAHQTVAAIG